MDEEALFYEKGIKYLPIVVLAVHTFFVLIIAAGNAIYGGESSMLWGLLMVVDFPSSFFLSWLIGSLESQSRELLGDDFTYTITFSVVFATIGGIQYFLVSWWFSHWIIKRRGKKMLDL